MFLVQQSPLGFFGMELPALCFILAFTCSLTHSFIQSFIKRQRLFHGLDRVVGDTCVRAWIILMVEKLGVLLFCEHRPGVEPWRGVPLRSPLSLLSLLA